MTSIDTDEIAGYRSRLTELAEEAAVLARRREELRRVRDEGPSASATEEAARALLAGATTSVLDVPAELRAVEERIRVNRAAQDLLSGTLGLLELRAGYRAALPAFERAMAHVATRAKLLDALELEFRAADADLAEFDRIAGAVVGLAAQHPDEPAPYREYQLELLRHWFGDFQDDGVNPTGLQRWRERAADLGVELTR